MKNTIELGMNRTGVDACADKKRAIEAAEVPIPSAADETAAIAATRVGYVEEGGAIGTMPPPPTVKGMAKAVVQVAKGAEPTIFLDKIGERLAFERTGTRLYTALLSKFDAFEPLPNGPRREDLEAIRDEERSHFDLLRAAMLKLGADPTAITPSADVVAVTSMGLVQVIGDPRMNLKQSLEAILVAELVDNDGWATLTELAVIAGQEALARQFREALDQEERHLSRVRGWVQDATFPRPGGARMPA